MEFGWKVFGMAVSNLIYFSEYRIRVYNSDNNTMKSGRSGEEIIRINDLQFTIYK